MSYLIKSRCFSATHLCISTEVNVFFGFSGFSLVGAYRMGLTVLKHCISSELTEGRESKRENSKGMAMLAMSTMLYER